MEYIAFELITQCVGEGTGKGVQFFRLWCLNHTFSGELKNHSADLIKNTFDSRADNVNFGEESDHLTIFGVKNGRKLN